MPLPTCDNIWLKRLILCLYPCVFFPFCGIFVEEVLFTMVTKTMQLHVLLGLVKVTTLLASFDL
jgi:hypothetical protein